MSAASQPFCNGSEKITNIRLVVKNILIVFSPRGGVRRSLADIVVATPGRLVDHINKNPGFCLEHLRFLVSYAEDVKQKQKITEKRTQSIYPQLPSLLFCLFKKEVLVFLGFFFRCHPDYR